MATYAPTQGSTKYILYTVFVWTYSIAITSPVLVLADQVQFQDGYHTCKIQWTSSSPLSGDINYISNTPASIVNSIQDKNVQKRLPNSYSRTRNG